MNTINYIILCPAIIFLSGSLLMADPGITGGEILNINSSAKAASLGEAMAGRPGEITSTVYNPAGLYCVEGTNFEVSHMLYFLNTHLSTLGYGQKLENFSLGMYFKYFMAEDKARDIVGEEMDKELDINYGQYTVAVALPGADEGQSWGAGVNLITESIYGESDSALSFNVGWHYRLDDRTSAGVVARNVGQSIKVGDTEVDLPRQAALAGEYRIDKFDFLWEIVSSKEYTVGFKSGVEASLSPGFDLRLGFSYITLPAVTLGFGVNKDYWIMDYAFMPHFDLGMTHRISLGIKL